MPRFDFEEGGDGVVERVTFEPRRYNMAKVGVSMRNLSKKAGAFAKPHPAFGPRTEISFYEHLFYAITHDNLEKFKAMLADLGKSQKPLNYNQYCFGMFVEALPLEYRYKRRDPSFASMYAKPVPVKEADKKDAARYRFIEYGAQQSACGPMHGALQQCATMQHVAVWNNSCKVAAFLNRSGASTSVKDGVGVSVFERARTREMRAILCCPPDPQEIRVVSLGKGRAILQWNMSPSKPPVSYFEVREAVSGMVWAPALESLQCFGEDKNGTKKVIFTSPPGSVWSGEKHTFHVRAVNADGIEGRWCIAECSVYAAHWLSEWNAESKIEEATEQKTSLNETFQRMRELKLGKMNYGMVPASQWYAFAQERQERAAILIESAFRGWLGRRYFAGEMKAHMEFLERTHCAIDIQKIWRGYVCRIVYSRHRWGRQRRRGRTLKSGQPLIYKFSTSLPRSWK